jgi:hypothetical protein
MGSQNSNRVIPWSGTFQISEKSMNDQTSGELVNNTLDNAGLA